MDVKRGKPKLVICAGAFRVRASSVNVCDGVELLGEEEENRWSVERERRLQAQKGGSSSWVWQERGGED